MNMGRAWIQLLVHWNFLFRRWMSGGRQQVNLNPEILRSNNRVEKLENAGSLVETRKSKTTIEIAMILEIPLNCLILRTGESDSIGEKNMWFRTVQPTSRDQHLPTQRIFCRE